MQQGSVCRVERARKHSAANSQRAARRIRLASICPTCLPEAYACRSCGMKRRSSARGQTRQTACRATRWRTKAPSGGGARLSCLPWERNLALLPSLVLLMGRTCTAPRSAHGGISDRRRNNEQDADCEAGGGFLPPSFCFAPKHDRTTNTAPQSQPTAGGNTTSLKRHVQHFEALLGLLAKQWRTKPSRQVLATPQ